MSDQNDDLLDFEAKNPRYAGLKGSDMVRALLRPKDPKIREALDRNRRKARKTDR